MVTPPQCVTSGMKAREGLSADHLGARGYSLKAVVPVALLFLWQPLAAVESQEVDLLAEVEQVGSALVRVEHIGASGATQAVAGFLVDPAGVIVTCLPDDPGQEVLVELASGERFSQVLVANADPTRGLLVLRIPGFELPVVRLGSSESLKPGAPVLIAALSPEGSPEPTVALIRSDQTTDRGVSYQEISTALASSLCGAPVLQHSGVVGLLVPNPDSPSSAPVVMPVRSVRGLLGFPATPQDYSEFRSQLLPSSSAVRSGVAETPSGSDDKSRIEPSAASPAVRLPEPLYVNVERDGALVEGRLRLTPETLIYEERLPSPYDFTIPWTAVTAVRPLNSVLALALDIGTPLPQWGRQVRLFVRDWSRVGEFLAYASQKGVRAVAGGSASSAPASPTASTPRPDSLPTGPVPLSPDVRRAELIPESVVLELDTLDIQTLGHETRVFTLRCLIREDGTVREAKLYRVEPDLPLPSSSRGGFVNAVETSVVKKWRFRPALRAGHPVSVWQMVNVEIKPSDDSDPQESQ